MDHLFETFKIGDGLNLCIMHFDLSSLSLPATWGPLDRCLVLSLHSINSTAEIY